MLSIGDLRKHVNLKPKLLSIDNTAFKLHYRITCWLLLLFTSILCFEQYNNNKIKCTHSDPTDSKKQLEHVISSFCFFMATFTVANHHNMSSIPNVAGPGIGPHTEDDEVIHHRYYQWVPYVLFLQGMSFYLPHYIWRMKEGGRLKALVDGFNFLDWMNENKRVEARQTVQDSFSDRIVIYKSWMRWMIFCEVLNLLNLILQCFITDWFLDGEFWGMGNYVYDNWVGTLNPLDRIFPKTGKCTFQKYGPAGSIQTHDVLCVLSLNIINEKIYITLWYWYIILGVTSVLMLIHRLLSQLLYASTITYNVTIFQQQLTSRPDQRDLLDIMNHLSYSEWFFLNSLVKNLDGKLAVELLHDMAEEYRSSGPILSRRANQYRDDAEVPLTGDRYESFPTLRAKDSLKRGLSGPSQEPDISEL